MSLTADEVRVLAAIDRLEPAYRALLQRLVQTPSPVGAEGAAQALVAQQMRDIGLHVETFDVEPAALQGLPAFNQTPTAYAGRPCVVGRLAGQGRGRSLLLNAHIDTVPVDAEETWTHPPYAGVIESGRLHGRGACDDKAGIVESLLVAHAIREAGLKLEGDLILASVIEDESSGNGTLATVERGHTADAVIIVDGTWPERFIVSHMGQVSFRIRLPGVAGHATSPGPNPIAAVGQVVEALHAQVAKHNAAAVAGWGGKANPVFVNLGTLRAGVWPGSVPAECVIEGQYGFVPPGTCDSTRADLEAAVLRAGARAEWPLAAPPRIEFVGLETPPHLGDPRNPIVELLAGVIERRDAGALQESVIAGHCDVRHYTGARRNPTSAACLFGPGGGRNVHGVDEYFELSHLPLVAGHLACATLGWCGVAHD